MSSRGRSSIGLGAVVGAIVLAQAVFVRAAPSSPLQREGLQPGAPSVPRASRLLSVVARGGGAGRPALGSLREIIPGASLGRITSGELARLAEDDPALDVEVLPELRRTTDRALPIIGAPAIETLGLTGRGTIVGVVDSGFDVKHPALRTPLGDTRMAWLLDFTRRARGKHAELETQFGLPGCFARAGDDESKAADGGVCVADARCSATPLPCAATLGAVFSAADIDALLRASPAPPEPIPTDEEGHGTHAMGIAAGTRVAGSPYRGVATEARMIGVKADGEGLSVDPLTVLAGVAFIFDRADAEGAPVSVNLSLTGDFVARDVPDAFASVLVALTRRPGRVLVASAGNSGDPVVGSHQTVSVAESRVRVPLRPSRRVPASNTSVEIIVSPHPGADVRIGCDAATGPWVFPVPRGRTRSAKIGEAAANVVFDPKDFRGRIPKESSSALVSMNGALPEGDAYVVIEGSGTIDLWIRGGSFVHGVREQTVGSPANHPEVIAVGATVGRESYRTMAGEELVLFAQQYDDAGLLPLAEPKLATQGQVGAFSGAGPGWNGAIKPDVLAPGVMIASAATSARDPRTSLFVGSAQCPARADRTETADPKCLLVEEHYGVSSGTSFAAPFVTGAAAILLEVDPTLTQAEARAALQAGVHPSRTRQRFRESASTGELDVPGSVDVVRRLRAPVSKAPSPARSWMTASSHYVPADGTRPLEILLHLRAETGEPADGFDDARFAVWAEAGREDRALPRRLERVAPGMWAATFDVPSDLARSSITVRADFEGRAIVEPVVLPIALDPWLAAYPSSASGASCSMARARESGAHTAAVMIAAFVVRMLRRLARRRSIVWRPGRQPRATGCGLCGVRGPFSDRQAGLIPAFLSPWSRRHGFDSTARSLHFDRS